MRWKAYRLKARYNLRETYSKRATRFGLIQAPSLRALPRRLGAVMASATARQRNEGKHMTVTEALELMIKVFSKPRPNALIAFATLEKARATLEKAQANVD